jgi:pyrroline-5-carboxylate reductase
VREFPVIPGFCNHLFPNDMNKLAFIGAGKMATAIVQGLLNRKLYQPADIACCSGPDDTGKNLSAQTGIRHYENPSDFPPDRDLFVLACKPQQIDSIDPTLQQLANGKTVLSILAGTTIAKLRAKFPGASLIIRTMPNTPGSIGEGVTGYAPEKELEPQTQKAIEAILGTLGHYLQVPEGQIDAITAISGSGPAYFFQFTNCLAQAGMEIGLPEEQARLLAERTFIGAAKLLEQSGLSPTELRNAVTSPGGTTQAALESFQANGIQALVTRGATAAKDRSIELSD